MSFHYRYRKQILLGFTLTVFFSFISIGVYFKWFHPNDKIQKDKVMVLSSKEQQKKEDNIKEEFDYVDVKGQVVSPGLYLLPKNSRVMDAITKAGGLLENADTTVLNLGKKTFDEMVIVVYSQEEVGNFVETKEKENSQYLSCQEQNEVINDACVEIEKENNLKKKISLNTASKEELQTLPGIGESKANDIIEYRNVSGPFEIIDDIKKVSGIGDNLFAKIKDYITI